MEERKDDFSAGRWNFGADVWMRGHQRRCAWIKWKKVDGEEKRKKFSVKGP
jgi:hypothetical protein